MLFLISTVENCFEQLTHSRVYYNHGSAMLNGLAPVLLSLFAVRLRILGATVSSLDILSSSLNFWDC